MAKGQTNKLKTGPRPSETHNKTLPPFLPPPLTRQNWFGQTKEQSAKKRAK